MSISVSLSTKGFPAFCHGQVTENLVLHQKFVISQLNSEYLNSVHGLYEVLGYLSRNLDGHLGELQRSCYKTAFIVEHRGRV